MGREPEQVLGKLPNIKSILKELGYIVPGRLTDFPPCSHKLYKHFITGLDAQ